MHELLKLFLKRLVQLDSGNRSLFLPRLSVEKDIDLHAFDFSLGKPSFHIIELLISNKPVRLCPVTDSRNSDNSAQSDRLKKIVRKEKSISEESGARDLYVGYPFVEGVMPGGLPIHCPLLFFPVQLEQKDNVWILSKRNDEPIEFNKSFLLAYAHFFQSKYDEELADTDIGELGIDSLQFRTSLYELLKASTLEINFNQELFQNKLQYFSENPKKEDFLGSHPEGLLKLIPEAVLGIFPQAGSFLEPDYQWLLDHVSVESLEDFFEEHQQLPESVDKTLRTNRLNSFIQSIKEEQTFTPFQIDIFQENAIKAVKYGQSLVVQGPPGTGKSQLISNLAADFMARGKNVLIVCQKRAALDVVKKRLSEAGIGDFVSLVHDFKYDRKGIFSKIDDQISKLEEYKTLNYKLDTVFLERQFQQASRRIDQITEVLEQFRRALYDSAISGISAKELYHRSNPQKASIPIPDFKKFPNHTWEEYKRVLRSFSRYELWAGKKDYIWRDRVSFSSFSHADKLDMIRLLSQIPEIGNELLSKHSSILKKGIHVEQLHALAPLMPRIQSLFDELSIPIRKSYYYISPNPKLSKKKIDKLFSDWKEFKTNGLRKPLPLSQVEEYSGKIQGYETAQRSFFQKIKWNLFSSDKKILQSLCQVEGLDFGKNEIAEVKKRLAFSKEFYAHVDYIQSQSWGKDFPVGQYEMEISNWFQELKSAVELKEKINLFLDGHPVVEDLFKDQHRVDSHWMSLSEIYTSWDNYIKSWSNFFTIGQIVQMISEPGHSGLMKSVLEKDFDLLVEFDLLKDRMLPHELELAYRLMSENMEQPEELFENSIQLEWLNHMEELLPILRSASTYKIEDLTKELQDKIREKQQLSHEIVVQNVRERVYRNTTFNRLNNRVTYRELQHQVSKKKKIWPLRKVLNEFHEEVFNLMPCWLASPESVSAIFPMEPWFDLVIFDEASQCFAEKGLPAMFRAKQIVVTGDSQQLPPNDLYQVRWDNPDDDSFDASVDSLLDLCARYLPQVQLSEHYRSQSPSLIGFSNEHFYRNLLRMVPHAKANTLNRPAIQFVHVPGLWENNSNKIEAEQVVRIAFDIIRQNPQKELGIVTFNFRQQNLILDLLEQESILQNIPLPESLIVKNIENIQGDEKDIILFSIGYAPDSKGKLIMNFGSLNSEGGQNRLNVAITRAKEQIIVVASLLPTQLLVDDAKHEGPRLLKKYLSYASQESTPNGETYPPSVYSKTGLNFQVAHYFEQRQAKKPLPGFPFADLAIEDGKAPLLLLTDDDRYYASLSSKDLHGYFMQRLTEKEWDYLQVFSRNFWLNFEEATNTLRRPPKLS